MENTPKPITQDAAVDWSECPCPDCQNMDAPNGSSPQPAISHLRTPWAVFCIAHGQVFLTHHEYNRQMNHANAFWECPYAECDQRRVDWDDKNYDAALKSIDPTE